MRVLLGMSGGLDSTYAAHKLKSMGYTVEGAVIKMHSYTETDEAVSTAASLGIPCHIINAEELFDKAVVQSFISEYRKGRTPNPCVICNSEVKFKLLYEYAMQNGFDKIATGHYAKLVKLNTDTGVRYAIARSQDEKKDQTYMLWRLPGEILKSLIFPLGDECKEEIKENSRKLRLFAVDREESQEICFIPDGNYAAYIETRVGKSPRGSFIDRDGNVLGEHKGIIHYTVGQRKGLGIALGKRAFITNINPIDNTITLDTLDTYSSSFTVSNLVFSGIEKPNVGDSMLLDVKHRYLAPLAPARVTFIEGKGSEGSDETQCLLAKLEFSSPIRAVTPGQSAVFYRDGILVAGGFIV